MNVGPESSRVICPTCHLEVLTKTEPKASTRTHVIGLLMCVFCCWVCVPFLYCTNFARNIDHKCPSCNSYIGTYER